MSTSKWNVDLYNDKHNFVYQYGESLVKLLDPQLGERILDLGCGSGELTAEIAKFAGEVIGIDQSAEMIDTARKRFPEQAFMVKDATNFQFDAPFDAIFSNAVLHWVLDKEAAIDCMHRNLKRGGRMVVEFGGKDNIQLIMSGIRRSLKDHGHVERSEITRWYFPSVGEYATLLEKAGFRVLEAYHFDRPTELADASKGIVDWLQMFGASFFGGLDEGEQLKLMHEVQEGVRDHLLIDGKWYADYKRLRIKAVKQ